MNEELAREEFRLKLKKNQQENGIEKSDLKFWKTGNRFFLKFVIPEIQHQPARTKNYGNQIIKIRVLCHLVNESLRIGNPVFK